MNEAIATIFARRIHCSSFLNDSSSSDSSEDEYLFNRRQKHIRIRKYTERIVPQYSDMDFKCHFRITKSTLEVILQEVIPFYRFLPRIGAQRRRPPIPVIKAVLFSIWIISNQESFRGVSDRFGIERGHGNRIFMYLAKIFYFKLLKKYIRWPKHNQEIMAIKQGFDELRPNAFPGVVGCIDGTHIKIDGPRSDNSYFNRKSYHSIVLQGICDAQMKFIDVYCGWPGSAHDARIFSNSPINKFLLKEPCPLPENTHLLGDTAYPLEPFLMCPYKDNGHLSRKQRLFNKKLSSSRVIIEQAFGMLKGRWRRLQHLPIKNFKYSKYYILFACVLHNMAIECNDLIDIELGESHDEDNDFGMLPDNDSSQRGRNQRLKIAVQKRDNISNKL